MTEKYYSISFDLSMYFYAIEIGFDIVTKELNSLGIDWRPEYSWWDGTYYVFIKTDDIDNTITNLNNELKNHDILGCVCREVDPKEKFISVHGNTVEERFSLIKP